MTGTAAEATTASGSGPELTTLRGSVNILWWVLRRNDFVVEISTKLFAIMNITTFN